MPNLLNIIEGLDADDRQRISQTLKLMNLQGIGSERYREDVKSWTKEDKSPVSVADLLHQSQVQQMIKDQFAGDGLVCEEPRAMQEQVVEEASAVSQKYYGSNLREEVIDLPDAGDITWMLDPIDGTKGYLAGRYYAIALGYFKEGVPYFGAMAVPHAPQAQQTRIDNALAFAVRGMGAWMGKITENGEPEFERLDSTKSPIEKPYRFAVSLEHGGGLGEMLKSGEIKAAKMDSQAKYLAVAAGEMDAYLRKTRGDGGTDVSWDHVPGAIIAREAGCAVENFDGSAITFKPQSVVRFAGGMACYRGASDGPVADAVRKICHSVVKG